MVGEMAGVIVTVEPGHDSRLIFQGGQHGGRIPHIVIVVRGDRMMREDDHFSPGRVGFRADPVKPGELRRADPAVPRLGLPDFRNLKTLQLGGGRKLLRRTGRVRIGADVIRVENHKPKLSMVEKSVARLQAEPFRHLGFQFLQHVEVVVAEQVVPAVTAGRERPGDLVKTPPLAIDQVAEVRAKREIASVEMLHGVGEFSQRFPVEPGALVVDVGELRVGDESDLETGLHRAAQDRRGRSREQRRFQKAPTVPMVCFHVFAFGNQSLKRSHDSQCLGHSAVGPSLGSMPAPCGPLG